MKILKNKSGIVAIEFAIILPVFLLLLAGVLDFGMYYSQASITDRAVNNASIAIQRQVDTFENIHKVALSSGNGLTDFQSADPATYICAKSFSSLDAANAGSCRKGEWDIAPPGGVQPYYVTVAAATKDRSMIVGSVLPSPKSRTTVIVGESNATYPVCNQPGKVLKTDANGELVCESQQFTFGGGYTTGGGRNAERCFGAGESNDASNHCRHPNVVTGGCSCPSGFKSFQTWEYLTNESKGTYRDGCADAPPFAVQTYMCVPN